MVACMGHWLAPGIMQQLRSAGLQRLIFGKWAYTFDASFRSASCPCSAGLLAFITLFSVTMGRQPRITGNAYFLVIYLDALPKWWWLP